jgi:hypothetical protein
MLWKPILYILLRILYLYYIGDLGKMTFWSSILIYLPCSMGSQSQFKLQLHYSYDDNNLSCLVQDSLLLVLLRLPSSVPSFSSFYGHRNLVFSTSLFFARLLALRFGPNYINSYNNDIVLSWFKTLLLLLNYYCFAFASISIDSTDCAMASPVDFGSPPLFIKLDAL